MHHITTKIKIHIDKQLKKHIKDFRLLQAMVFFWSEVAEPYEKKYNEACVRILMEDEDNNRAGFFCVEGQDLHFWLNAKKVQEAVSSKTAYKSFRKSLFFVLLHEMGHGIHFLQKCRSHNLEACYKKWRARVKKTYERMHAKDPSLSKSAMTRNIPEEIFADRFAYRHLTYFENLYEFQGYVI
jgi:hypothetical protein